MHRYDTGYINCSFDIIGDLYDKYIELRKNVRMFRPDGWNDERALLAGDLLETDEHNAAKSPDVIYGALCGALVAIDQALSSIPQLLEHYAIAAGEKLEPNDD